MNFGIGSVFSKDPNLGPGRLYKVCLQVEVQLSINYFKMFLPQKAGTFGNNMEKEAQEPLPKLKKYVYYIYRVHLLRLNPMQVVLFCKNVLIFRITTQIF